MKIMNLLSLLVYFTLLANAVKVKAVSSSSPLTKSGSEQENWQNQLTTLVLNLFKSDLIHNSNFILFKTSPTATIQESKDRDFLRNYDTDDNNKPTNRPIHSIVLNHNHNIHNHSTVGEIFQTALSSCILPCDGDTHHRSIFIIEIESIEVVEEILSNIRLFYQHNPSRSSTVYFFLLLPLPLSTNHSNNNNTELSVTNIMSIINNSTTYQTKTPLNSHLYIMIGEQNTIDSLGKVSTWEYYDVNGKHIFEEVADSRDFFQIWKRRVDFRGTIVKGLAQRDYELATVDMELKKEAFNGEILYNSFVAPISKTRNFSFQIVEGEGWIYDNINSSGLTGMGKQLMNNEADFTMSLSEMLPFRIKYLDASQPSYTFKIYAYFRQPPPSLYRDIFLEAFSTGLWAVVLITWVVIIVCLLLFSYTKRRFCPSSCSASDEMIAGDAVYWALAVACQKGWHCTPTSASIQIVFFCGLIASFLYYTAYSASIISIFSVDMKHINTFSDLLSHGFKLFADNMSISGQRAVRDQALEDGVEFESRILNATQALRKIENSRTAYVSSHHIFFPSARKQNNSRRTFCEFLSKSSGWINIHNAVFYYRKFDALRKFFDLQITRWKETGLLYRWNQYFLRLMPAPCEPKPKKPIPLEFLDVRTAFIILIGGFFGCICILIYEIVFHHTKH